MASAVVVILGNKDCAEFVGMLIGTWYTTADSVKTCERKECISLLCRFFSDYGELVVFIAIVNQLG